MKKIDFGYNNEDALCCSIESLDNYCGEYIDTICINNLNYLITRIKSSKKELNGNIDVREIVNDYYPDGSFVTYSNQDRSEEVLRLHSILNEKNNKEKIKDNIDICTILEIFGLKAHKSYISPISIDTDTVFENVISIKPHLFMELRSCVNHMHGSIFEMYQEIKILKEQAR